MSQFLKFCSLSMLAAAVILAGCSSSKPMPKTQDEESSVQLPDDYPPAPASSPDGVKYVWARSAIALEVYTGSALNVYEDRVHNLMVCMYQMADMKGADEKINNIKSGSRKDLEDLLNCEPFDETVINARRFFLKPRMHRVFKFDREKDVRYVMLVAGYATSEGAENTLSVKIPLLYDRDGIIFKDDQYSAATLKMRLFFGQNRMENLVDGERFTDMENADSAKELSEALDGIVVDSDAVEGNCKDGAKAPPATPSPYYSAPVEQPDLPQIIKDY